MLQVTSRGKDMIVDTHVHIWEIAPPKYPLGPTISTWNHYPTQPGTAEELMKEMEIAFQDGYSYFACNMDINKCCIRSISAILPPFKDFRRSRRGG